MGQAVFTLGARGAGWVQLEGFPIFTLPHSWDVGQPCVATQEGRGRKEKGEGGSGQARHLLRIMLRRNRQNVLYN